MMVSVTLLRIEISGESEQLSQRAQRRVTKAAHYAAGAYWDRRFLRLHFMASAGARYGYQARAKKTTERKKQLAKRGFVKKGGTVDLVHSGRLESAMMHRHVVRAFPNRVIVQMPSTSYVSHRPRGARINMASEITRVIPSEMTAINAESQKALDAETKKEIKNNRYKKKV